MANDEKRNTPITKKNSLGEVYAIKPIRKSLEGINRIKPTSNQSKTKSK
ncbi:MAG: hypothetical protein JW803_04275 [Endomicrobiales bacterium]|nr:hypothetical protein [Endomicrobiales bacterium]